VRNQGNILPLERKKDVEAIKKQTSKVTGMLLFKRKMQNKQKRSM
jgi:hypothetical protein